MKTVTVLKKARALLAKDGWCQGAYTNNNGEHCVMGAIRACTPDYWDQQRQSLDAYLALKSVIHQDPVVWNDQKGRTMRQVLKAFDEAIRAEERKAKR